MTYAIGINGSASRALTLHVDAARVLEHALARATVEVDLGVAPGDFTVIESDVTAPVVVVAPVAAGGVMVVSYSGGVADEPVVASLKATRSGFADQIAAYGSVFNTSFSQSMSVIESGTYRVWMRIKDSAGNETAWVSLGNVTAAPPIGG